MLIDDEADKSSKSLAQHPYLPRSTLLRFMRFPAVAIETIKTSFCFHSSQVSVVAAVCMVCRLKVDNFQID